MGLRRAAAVAWLALPGVARAGLGVDIEALHLGPVSVHGVHVEAALPLGRPPAGVQLRARSVRAGGRPLARGLTLECRSLALGDGVLRCPRGTLDATVAGIGRVSGRWSVRAGARQASAQLELAPERGGVVRLSATLGPRGWRLGSDARDLPVAGVQALVTVLLGALPGGATASAGDTAWRLDARGRGGHVERLAASLALRGVDVEGASAAEGVDARIELALRRSAGWQVALQAAMSAGLAYVELPPLRAGAPAPGLTVDAGLAPVTLTLNARQDADGGWGVEALRLEQRSVLSIEGRGALRRAGDGWRLVALDGGVAIDDLARAWPAWVQPWLLGSALDALETSGALGAAVQWRDGRLVAARLLPRRLEARDRLGRFALDGLDGTIAFTAGDQEVRSSVRWQGLSFYRLPFGGGGIALASRRGRAWMTTWEGVSLFDGRLVVDRLELRVAPGPPRLELDGTLTPVSLAALSRALGGPPLAGTVAASLAGLTLEPSRLSVGGALEVAAFGGRISVTGLRLDDPLGLVPVLHADVTVRDVDLEQLTAELAFGRISGHLDGYVRELELQAWQPVYFEAAFATPEDDDAPHRISQRAVTNLGRLGGGGTAVLSRGVLRLFSEYSYGRLGFRCRLIDGMLEIDGIEPAEGGSWLLTPGGLLPPWIGIRALGHAVPWTTLTDTLRAIRSGEVDVQR